MRLKLIKKYNAIYLAYSIVLLGVLALVIFKKAEIKPYLGYLILAVAGFSLIFMAFFHYFENNEDKKIINKMVLEGKMALCKIDSAKFEKFFKDSTLRRYVIWRFEATIYDRNLQVHKVNFYDQFALLQDSVPQGYCYVTYDENKPENIFIVPNMLVGAYESNKDLIINYEKKIKAIKYLNVYYNHGLVVETFKDSLNKKKEEYEFNEERARKQQ